MTKNELLQILEGNEILSIHFEGCVMVRQGQIIQYGKVIDGDPTKNTLQVLFDELYDYELNDFSLEFELPAKNKNRLILDNMKEKMEWWMEGNHTVVKIEDIEHSVLVSIWNTLDPKNPILVGVDDRPIDNPKRCSVCGEELTSQAARENQLCKWCGGWIADLPT